MASTDKVLATLAGLLMLGAACVAIFAFTRSGDAEFEAKGYAMQDSDDDEATERARREAPPRQLRKVEDTQPVAVVEIKKPKVEVVAGEGKIVGTVTSGEDEEARPVEGATVRAELYFPGGEPNFGTVESFSVRATSDEDGRFSLDVPNVGAYRIEVRHGDFAPSLLEKIRPGAELEVKLEAGASLEGVVVAKGSRKAVSGARLTLRKNKSPWSHSVVTDEEGRYSFHGVFAEVLYLTVEHADFVTLQDQEIALEIGLANERKVELDPGKKIRGVVKSPQGVPVERAIVRISGREAETTFVGEFAIGGLATAQQNVEVIAEGFLTHYTSINLSGSREEAEVEITLSTGGTVEGAIYDDAGTPLPGVEVKVFESWGSDYMYETGETRFVASSDENGLFRITGLAQNGWSGYRARARAEGYADTFSDEIKIQDAKKPVNVRLIMSAGGKISGKVLDPSGEPVIGAKLSLNANNVYEWSSDGAKSRLTTISGDDGSYSFTRLAPRTYRISVIALGHSSQYRSDLKITGAAQLEGIDFTLDLGEAVIGTVKNEDGAGIEGAWVNIYSKKSWGRAQTDAEGNYLIENLGAGPYSANAFMEGFSNEQKKDVYPESGRLDFELKRSGYVWGEVRDKASGEPVKVFQVELHKPNPRRNNESQRVHQTWVNDPSGKFKLYAKDGTYKLVVRARGFILFEQEGVRVDITDAPEELAIKVVPGGAIEGWLRDYQGLPITGADVYVRKTDGTAEPDFRHRSSSERDGYFFVDSLEEGTYEVAFYAWGRLPLIIEPYVSVQGGDLRLITISSRQPPRLRVTLKDDKDKPTSGQVRLDHVDGEPVAMNYVNWKNGVSHFKPSAQRSNYVGRNGLMILDDLRPGTYRLTYQRKGFKKVEQDITLREGELEEVEIKLESDKKKDEEKKEG
ncbi:MAG: carboxypeptidase-like regulatory domain-containing protein [Planctomycetota bacterium]